VAPSELIPISVPRAIVIAGRAVSVPRTITKRSRRDMWPKCGRPRRRDGKPCQAPGSGIGGACRFHGGHGWDDRIGSLVLFDHWDARDVGRRRRPGSWSMWAASQKAWSEGTRRDGRFDLPRGPRGGKPEWARRGRWPCLIGIRAVVALVRKGRVSRIVVSKARTWRQLVTLREMLRVHGWSDKAWHRFCAEHLRLAPELFSPPRARRQFFVAVPDLPEGQGWFTQVH
jgi:hypothetical protein